MEPGDSGQSVSPYLNQFTTVAKGYGKSLVHPTSPTKILVPQPVNGSAPNSDPKQSETEDHPMEAHPLLQAPTSPTRVKPEPKTSVAATGNKDGSPRGIAGVDSTGTDAEIASLPGDAGSGRGRRSSKRFREDRGGSSSAKEQPGSGSTANKRKKV